MLKARFSMIITKSGAAQRINEARVERRGAGSWELHEHEKERPRDGSSVWP